MANNKDIESLLLGSRAKSMLSEKIQSILMIDNEMGQREG